MFSVSFPCATTPQWLLLLTSKPFVFSLRYLGQRHYDDIIMGTKASQITSLTIVYSTVYSDADQSKHQSSASQAFVREIHRGPVNSPHKWPVTWKIFPFDDVIMVSICLGKCTGWPLQDLDLMAVALINKMHTKVRTTHPIITKLGSYISLGMLITGFISE